MLLENIRSDEFIFKAEITINFLKQFQEFNNFETRSNTILGRLIK